jgi:hypothetical protein
MTYQPIVAVEWVAFLLGIQEVLGFNPGLEIGYPELFFVFASFNRGKFGIVP